MTTQAIEKKTLKRVHKKLSERVDAATYERLVQRQQQRMGRLVAAQAKRARRWTPEEIACGAQMYDEIFGKD